MKITQEEINGIVIVSIFEDIDLYNVSKVRNLLDDLYTNSKHKIIIDLKNVDYMDSSGLSVFIREMSRLKKVNHTLKLANVKEGIERLFKWTTINMYVEKYGNLEDALISFDIELK
jgi:anti-sigma B factor antagonist